MIPHLSLRSCYQMSLLQSMKTRSLDVRFQENQLQKLNGMI